uniref:Uncharacterized protein n=1 Tax=Lactuca sativa TaxID=4236 RepID=A0A9R1X647_LACSA|nr:hypothetical protein LSAT_V11C600299900 [Lactuca sativa]
MFVRSSEMSTEAEPQDLFCNTPILRLGFKVATHSFGKEQVKGVAEALNEDEGNQANATNEGEEVHEGDQAVNDDRGAVNDSGEAVNEQMPNGEPSQVHVQEQEARETPVATLLKKIRRNKFERIIKLKLGKKVGGADAPGNSEAKHGGLGELMPDSPSRTTVLVTDSRLDSTSPLGTRRVDAVQAETLAVSILDRKERQGGDQRRIKGLSSEGWGRRDHVFQGTCGLADCVRVARGGYSMRTTRQLSCGSKDPGRKAMLCGSKDPGRKAMLCGPKGPGRRAILCGPKGPGRKACVGTSDDRGKAPA